MQRSLLKCLVSDYRNLAYHRQSLNAEMEIATNAHIGNGLQKNTREGGMKMEKQNTVLSFRVPEQSDLNKSLEAYTNDVGIRKSDILKYACQYALVIKGADFEKWMESHNYFGL